MAELRDYQLKLLQKVLHKLETDPRARIMMQLPTGGGKTVIAVELLSRWLKYNRKAVWLTHRRELVKQTHDMLRVAGVLSTIDMRWSPGDPAPSRPGGVVVLMAQKVGRRTSRLNANTWARYGANDLMIIDEAHHAPADGYVRAMQQWSGQIVGMTATPWRLLEHEGFDHLFQDLVCGPQIAALQSAGGLCKSQVLLPPSVQRIVGGGRFGANGDYTPSGITKANEGPREVMTAGAVQVWRQYAASRQTIAYAVSVPHAENLQRFFQADRISSKVIHAKTSPEDRDAAIADFKTGSISVLINVEVATEGFDLPDASCVMMTRPTLSLSLYLQMVGRGLRPKPDGGYCLILDLAGNTLKHGVPEADRSWTLEPRGKQTKSGLPSAHDGRLHDGGLSCGRCGRLRGLGNWQFVTHCGNDHDLVCDLCHIDAHIEAHLPVAPPLDVLIEPERHSAALSARSPDRAALVALYHATDGPNWEESANWLTDAPLEQWYGVTIGDAGRVSALNLSSNRLAGKVPRALANLANLAELDLSDNLNLTWETPTWLGDLNKLTVLRLGDRLLGISGFGGEVPGELANLTNLTELDLSGHEFDCEIPRWLGNLTNLTVLRLESWALGKSGFDGEVPAELANLVNLIDFSLGHNRLSGEIPLRLSQLTNLVRLDLGGNQLSGEIPRELGRLVNLRYLHLQQNQLTGVIPRELAHLTNLRYLDLGWNQLSGEIPRQLGRLTRLTELSLEENKLTGEIPRQLGYLTNLTTLRLLGNQLRGEIPRELGSLTNLTYLDLGRNQLSGAIPWELGRLIRLTKLSLGQNELSGEIPRELGSLTNLTYLDLARNQLSGVIPPELVYLTNLNFLLLLGNQLRGAIPHWFGDFNNLECLDLGENQLSGEIPRELGRLADLATLDLGENQLSGEIPWELGRLTNLTELNLSRNQLSGEIPWELGRLADLATLDLGENQLSGEIPRELSRLTNLTGVYLEGNKWGPSGN